MRIGQFRCPHSCTLQTVAVLETLEATCQVCQQQTNLEGTLHWTSLCQRLVHYVVKGCSCRVRQPLFGVGKLFPPRNVSCPHCSSLVGMDSGYFVQATGDIYSGSWIANNKSGKGMYQFGADDSTMHGLWVDGTITEGKWVFKVTLPTCTIRAVALT